MAKMKTGMPAQKVTAATAAAALAAVIIGALGETIPGLERFGPEFVTVITFLFGYFVPPSGNDLIE